MNPPTPDKRERAFGPVFFREGDRVMQVKNNYDVLWQSADGKEVGLGIFNGDIGRVQSIDPGGLVTVDFEGHLAQYTPDMMNQLEPAYAITVHKAQGSEYRAVILAAVEAAPMLLTRGVLVHRHDPGPGAAHPWWGDEAVLARMAANDRQQRRYSGLRARLSRTAAEQEENHVTAPPTAEPALPAEMPLL